MSESQEVIDHSTLTHQPADGVTNERGGGEGRGSMPVLISYRTAETQDRQDGESMEANGCMDRQQNNSENNQSQACDGVNVQAECDNGADGVSEESSVTTFVCYNSQKNESTTKYRNDSLLIDRPLKGAEVNSDIGHLIVPTITPAGSIASEDEESSTLRQRDSQAAIETEPEDEITLTATPNDSSEDLPSNKGPPSTAPPVRVVEQESEKRSCNVPSNCYQQSDECQEPQQDSFKVVTQAEVHSSIIEETRPATGMAITRIGRTEEDGKTPWMNEKAKHPRREVRMVNNAQCMCVVENIKSCCIFMKVMSRPINVWQLQATLVKPGYLEREFEVITQQQSCYL